MQSETLSETEKPRPRPSFLPSLNGARGIAAFLVFGGHFLAMQFATPVGAAEIYEAGDRGASDAFFTTFFGVFFPVPMDYFFIVSGFVLAWAYRPGQVATDFWRRRFAKVYPVYLVTTLICLVLFGIIWSKWASWKVDLTHLFLLQAWVPDQNYSLGLSPVMWTLSSEAFNYLMFPALMLVFARATRRGLALTIAGCTAATFLLPWLVSINFDMKLPGPEVVAPLEGFDNLFTYWFAIICPIPRLIQFILGIALAVLIQRYGGRRLPNVPVALLIFFVGLGLTIAFLPPYLASSAGMLLPVALLIAALAKADAAGKWTPMRLRPFLFMGKVSYSFYAVHIIFIVFTIVQLPRPDGAWDFPRVWLYEAGFLDAPTDAVPNWLNVVLFLVYFGLALLSAWILYRFVELPLNRLIRGKGARPSAAELAATGGSADGPLSPSASIDAPISPADAPAHAGSATHPDYERHASSSDGQAASAGHPGSR